VRSISATADLDLDWRRLEARVIEDFFGCEEPSVKVIKEELMADRKKI